MAQVYGCLSVNRTAENGSPLFHNDHSRHHFSSEVKIECYNSSCLPANARQVAANSYLFRLHFATSERHYENTASRCRHKATVSMYLTLTAEQNCNHLHHRVIPALGSVIIFREFHPDPCLYLSLNVEDLIS